MNKPILTLILVAFTALNVYGLFAGGLDGAIALFKNANAWSVVLGTDLVISLSLLCGWMIRDAKKNGRAALPYVLLTVATGSIGPLLYLVRGRAVRAPL